MGNIQNVQEINETKNKVETELPEFVEIDTKGETVSINGQSFHGKKLVKREFKGTIMRLVAASKEQKLKEKEYKEHPDKFVGNVSGKGYR